LQGRRDEASRSELERVHQALVEGGFRHFLPAVAAALAV
jgi:hypothetical protein